MERNWMYARCHKVNGEENICFRERSLTLTFLSFSFLWGRSIDLPPGYEVGMCCDEPKGGGP